MLKASILDGRSRLWAAVALFAVLAAVLLRLAALDVPLDRDEGMYAYGAWRALDGERLYVDVVDSKPPGIFAVYGLALALGGGTRAIHATLIAVTVLCALLIFRLTRKWYTTRAACIAAALLALTQVAPAYFGFSANVEQYMALLIIAALLSLPRDEHDRQPWRYVLCGALIGAAALFKPVALTEGLPILALVWLAAGRTRQRLAGLALVGAGFGLTLALCLAYFACRGSASELIYWALGYNVGYSSSIGLDQRWRILAYEALSRGMLARDLPLLAVASIGAVTLLRRTDKKRAAAWFAPAWLLSAFIGVSASGRYTPHYFQQLLPPLCMLAAIGGDKLIDITAASGLGESYRRVSTCVILLLLLVFPTAAQWPLYRLSGNELSRTMFGLNPFVEGELVGAYLAENTDPEQTVYVLGSEPQFAYHARRRLASSIAFTAPLIEQHPDSPRLRQRVLEQIERNQPRYVVRMRLPSSLVIRDDPSDWFIGKLESLLQTDYQREAALLAEQGRQPRLVVGELPPVGRSPIVLDIYRRK
ncbi:MAG: glycosyltransferase family 39 protein [Candidatus Alcyoniella australis]|nr:glycosyltransferase family 39 protein [Candidatus Alcyoniella australis]